MFTEMTKEEMAALIKEEIRSAVAEASAPKEKPVGEMTGDEFRAYTSKLLHEAREGRRAKKGA